jgi:hypothetical protein
MRKISIALLAVFLITTSFKTHKKYKSDAPTLTLVTYQFFTTGADKEWNTQVGAQIVFDGRTVAENFCCNVDKKKDHWQSNTNSPDLEMVIHEHLSKDDFNHSSCVISSRSNGNDKWEFDLRIHAEFSDHTDENWTILSQSLNSIESHRAINTYPLSESSRRNNY